jgi:hypothetical protein
MNNTFNFNRFNKVLAYDWKRFIRNFGITLLVWISMPVMFWVTSLVFNIEIPVEAREIIIFGIVAITIMSAPSRIYGKVNLPREGVGFAMLPATNLEKFFSMFLYCSLVTPAVTLVGSWLVDCLMTLLPFGGFKEIAMHEDFLRNISFSDFILLVVVLVTTVWAESSIFMFGNMLFKRRKSGKTFGWFLLIVFVLVLFLQLTNGWELFDVIFSTDSKANVWIFSAIMLVIACGFYVGTYRKIKSQKY